MPPAPTILDQLGGEPALRALVNLFYDLVETDPRGAEILKLHFRGHGLAHVREKQFNFLSGFLGHLLVNDLGDRGVGGSVAAAPVQAGAIFERRGFHTPGPPWDISAKMKGPG